MNYHDASLLGIAAGIACVLGFSRLVLLAEQYDDSDMPDMPDMPEEPVMAFLYALVFLAGFGLVHAINLPFAK